MRHRAFIFTCVLAAGVACAPSATAQMNPRGEATLTLAGKPIVVEYGRPSLKGRDMLGRAAVGDEWRMGADGATTVAFTRCPFQAYAQEQPELVCSLHRGLVEGFADARGGTVVAFSTLVDRDPCRVQLADR